MVDIQLHLGDCLDVLRGMADNSVDAIIADPPYGAKRPSARRSASDRFGEIANNDGVYVEWLVETTRVLRQDRACYVFACWQTMELWRKAMHRAGLAVRSCIIWDKNVHGLADLKTCYAPRYEMILYGNKGRNELRGARPKDIISCPRVPSARLLHPYQKPDELIAQLILHSTDEGMVVLDPFAGSGTTGVACVQTGRNFIGVEISEEYFHLAERRIAEAQMQPALL